MVQGLTVVPVMATLKLEEGMPASLADALAAEIGLQYQIPESDGHTSWCVGSLDVNIGGSTLIRAIDLAIAEAHRTVAADPP